MTEKGGIGKNHPYISVRSQGKLEMIQANGLGGNWVKAQEKSCGSQGNVDSVSWYTNARTSVCWGEDFSKLSKGKWTTVGMPTVIWLVQGKCFAYSYGLPQMLGKNGDEMKEEEEKEEEKEQEEQEEEGSVSSDLSPLEHIPSNFNPCGKHSICFSSRNPSGNSHTHYLSQTHT